jgi:hypothetical protein
VVQGCLPIGRPWQAGPPDAIRSTERVARTKHPINTVLSNRFGLLSRCRREVVGRRNVRSASSPKASPAWQEFTLGLNPGLVRSAAVKNV